MGKDTRKPLKHVENIVFDNVFFYYPTRPEITVLNGCSMTINKGQKVAFVGQSGCGKSTMICLLERFYDPTQGRVLVNGEDLKLFSIGTVRSVMGYVGQEPVLFAGTIRDNVTRGSPTATEDELEHVLQMAECWFIKTLPDRLETYGGAGGGQFSGGQKQRIAIARALLKKPLVLLLDEASSALDTKSEQMIQDTLDQLSEQRGGNLTMVSIAHRLSTIRACDVIFMFMAGKVHEKGSHRDLMLLQGEYYSLAESQAAAMVSMEDSEDDDENADPDDVANDRDMRMMASATDSYGQLGPNRDSKIIKNVDLQQSKLRVSMTLEKEQLEADLGKAEVQKYKAPMSRLMLYSRKEWYLIPFACIGALCTGGSFPFIGTLIVTANDSMYIPDIEEAYTQTMEVVYYYFIIMGVMWCGTVLQYGTCSIMAEGMIKRMRVHILTHILRQEVGFHDDPSNTAAQMGLNLQQWAFRISALSDAICVNFATFGSVIIGITCSMYYCWQVCLMMSVCFPLVVICSILQVIISLSISGSSEIPEAAKTLISETVQNPKTVQALGIEEEMCIAFVNLSDPYRAKTSFKKKMKILLASWIFGLTNAVMMYVLTLNYWFTSFLIKERIATYGDSNRAVMAMYYAAIGAGATAVALGDNGKAQRAAKEMFELLDTNSKIEGLEPDGVMPPQGFRVGNIEFKNVAFAYPFRQKVQILKGMNFVVKSGQSVGLVGPSGGGKSTILALIQRFYDPQEGQVLLGVERMNLVDLHIRWWRSQLGYVGQEPVLFNTSVRQNVIYGAGDGEEVSQETLDKCLAISNLGFIFENNGSGWETEVGPKGSRLSGGQKQRVAICRALIKNPPILLLDEATSALDNTSERIVSKALEEARDGRTSFSIAHRLSTVEECDLLLVCAEGRIVEKGRDAELMLKGGVYLKLQEAQGKESFCCA